MDKHSRLFDRMPEAAGWIRWLSSKYDPEFVLLNHQGNTLVEHAARLHYEGEGYEFRRCDPELYAEVGWYTAHADGFHTLPMPLIDALLAAAEHAREGGEGDDA